MTTTPEQWELRARARIERVPALKQRAEVLTDPEAVLSDAHHWQWVATADLGRICSWVDVIGEPMFQMKKGATGNGAD